MSDLTTLKVYRRSECVVFHKTRAAFGGLSNMAAGFPLRVNSVTIATSEALYQACRFPDRPDIQEIVLTERSPIAAKMKARHFAPACREDWEVVRVPIMTWCLRVKLAQHWMAFGNLLLLTHRLPIVEESHNDPFWGAVPADADTLRGANVLGQLLAALRDRLYCEDAMALLHAPAPGIDNFMMLGERIQSI
ncbi:MAG: NADAR family protein [Anaerolineae bacterium]